jgi:hypothetical protein
MTLTNKILMVALGVITACMAAFLIILRIIG